MDVACPECGALHWIQERIATSSRTSPRFNMCCLDGDVVLPPIRDPPPQLRALYESNLPHAAQFRANIRRYNGALAFTSVNYRTDTRVDGGFVPFQIQGELFHLQGPLENDPAVAPVFAQVWFHDPEFANSLRCERDPAIDRATLGELTEVLQSVNPYIDLYKTAREQLVTMESHTGAHASLTAELALAMDPGADRRRENLPTASEVAAIVPDVGPDSQPSRDLQLTLRAPRGGYPLQRVSTLHPSYLPLHYVLLFPHGDPGWHPGLRLLETHGPRKRTQLTMSHYHAYRLFPRLTEFNTLFRGQRLFQQYLVDAAATIDQNHLTWIRNNQKKIRADLYQALEDAMAAAGDATDRPDGPMGRRIVLPSSHSGSERSMRAAYMDAMAITGRFRKPHLFITKTANPSWVEVQRELLPGQTAMDRPDLMARVFRLKKEQMLREIFHDGIFGRCPARVWTIEYQKRGLPHLHLLVFLEDSDHFLEPEVIDEMVCAELPDPSWDEDGELAEVVRSAMIHGPCGEHNPNAPCMEAGECAKRYPKPFCEETTVAEDGYPLYRRRNDPRTAFHKMVRGTRVDVDNRWVVPYSPYLTRRYRAHINVEVCSSIKVIKYLYKYIFKGGTSPRAPPSRADALPRR
jgi:Helitron helicase-like domain at N-terminus